MQLDHTLNAKVVDVPWMDPPNMPTVAGGDLDQLQQQVSSIVSKIEKVQFDKLGEDLQATLSNTAQLMRRLDRD